MNIIDKIKLLIRYQLTVKPGCGPEVEKKLPRINMVVDLDDYYEKLHKFEPNFSIDTLGKVKFRRKTYPILLVALRRNNHNSRKKLLIISGVHGNEQGAVLATIDILSYVKETRFNNLEIKVLAPANPVGVGFNSRLNGDGYDINRDYSRLETIEAKVINSVIDDFNPDLIVSLHEGPQKQGTFFYSNKQVPLSLVKVILDSLTKENIELTDRDYYGFKMNVPGWIPLSRKTTLLSKIVKYLFGVISLGFYMQDKGIPTITVETSWLSEERDYRINSPLTVVKAVVNYLNNE